MFILFILGRCVVARLNTLVPYPKITVSNFIKLICPFQHDNNFYLIIIIYYQGSFKVYLYNLFERGFLLILVRRGLLRK